MKIFQKLKKWLAGFLAIQLVLVSVAIPTIASAINGATVVTVSPAIVNDSTPALSGTVSNPDVTIKIYFNVISGVGADAVNNGDGTWTLADDTVVALANGVYDVIAIASDGARDISTDELTVDTQSPTAEIVSPSEGDYVAGLVKINITTWDLTPDRTQLELISALGTETLYDEVDGTNYAGILTTWDTTTYDDGAYTLRLTAYDHFSQPQMSDVNITVDNTAPVVKTKQELLQQSPMVISAPAEKLNDDGVYVVEDNRSVTVTTEWELVTPVTEGSIQTYRVIYHVTDLAGNTTDSTPVMVELTTKEFDPAVGTLPVALLGNAVMGHERGTKYIDEGALVSSWTSEALHVWTFGNLNTKKAGQYRLGYQASEGMGLAEATIKPNISENRDITVVDTIGPNAVSNLKAFSGNGYVQLTWENPIVDDLAGVNIYRSLVPGEKGAAVATGLSADTVSYDDYTVVNGETYYYTVAAYDKDGTNGIDSAQVDASPRAPKVVAATESYYDDSQNDVFEAQEVKSDDTQNKVEIEDESSVPVIGIIILVLLIILGIYLLYLQNPEWFNWAFFWKRKRVKAKVKTKKK